MITKIKGEQPFQVLATNFSISPSNEDYTLQISADGENYSDLFTVSAGQTKMCTGMANGSFYRLKNNESDVEVNWRTQCNDGGSGGGGGSQYILPPATANNLGGIKVGEGLAITNDGTLSTSGGSIDSGAVQTQIDNSLASFSQELQSGEPIVGMAAQLYSPDGVTSEGWYAYRTTAGNEDVNTGDAELRKIEGNTIYPSTINNDSASLKRGGETVEGFEAEISQETSSWETFSATAVNQQYRIKKARYLNLSKGGANTVRIFMNFCSGESTSNYYLLEAGYNGTYCSFNGLTGKTWETTVTGGGLTVNVSASGNNLYYEIVDGPSDAYIGYMTQLYGSANMEVEIYIPYDIPFGVSTYEYTTAWTPSLPQAVTAMTLNSETYVPQDGDEITITRTISSTGSAVYMKPTAFVALGLNSFDYTCEGVLTTLLAEGKKYSYDSNDGEYKIETDSNYNTYAIYAVTGLTNGYVIHLDGGSFNTKTAGVADTNDAVEIDNADFDTTIENGNLIVYPTTAMPYIILSVPTADADKVCVHPRWSGKMDEGFEEYRESMIDLSNLVDDCPLLSIGEVRNTIDLQNKKFVERISMEPYSQEAVDALVENGKVLGTDFNIDEDYIYVVNSTPQEDDIDIDAAYKDNDFSVEYFLDENGIIPQAIFAENYYITNLVDKLRRLKTDFIHLDDPNTAGEVGKVYEYQGRLMKWVEGSGYTAEWLKPINSIEGNEGTGLIYASIPDGTVLFDYDYTYGYGWRTLKYSGNTLYYVDSSGNTISAITIGQKFTLEASKYPTITKISGVFEDGYIGFVGSDSPRYQNVWSGKVEGGHYELIDRYNHPYLGSANDTDAGIVKFNGLGQVVRKQGNISTKRIYINTTGNLASNRTVYYTDGNNNGPDRWFAPITGGDAGQTLVSAGSNAAPVWSDWIKVVKITSDAYEALTTKDPNTLYAIDDE